MTQIVYTRALGVPGGIGGLISQARSGVTSWYHYVHTGPTNVSHLTNSTEAVIQRYEFDAFGNITYTSGTTTNDYRFQTKQLHAKSNLVYFGARWYNSAIGRWTTPDPMGMIDGPNLYVYLNNNPINDIDPWGLCGGPPPLGQQWGVKDRKIFVVRKGVGFSKIFSQINQWISKYSSVDITFNAGAGFGVSGQLSITGSGISGYIGGGWGIGWGISVTGGVNLGSSSGWGFVGSVSGGGGFGGTVSGTISQGGSSVNVGVGWGVGSGGTVTVGYGGEIIIW